MPVFMETTRLVLKQFVPDDARHLYELNTDPDVVRYTGEQVYTHINDVQASLLRNYDQYEKYKQGRLSVFLKQTGEYIGWCGLRYFPESGKTDLGYRLLKKHWGKGYATEASIACLNYGFQTLGLQEITAEAMKGNAASIHIFHKLGLKYSHDSECGGIPGVVYVIRQEDWK